MKFRYVSDLHNEFEEYEFEAHPDDSETVLIIAGDFYTSKKPERVIKYLSTFVDTFMEVVIILGNHDFWRHTLYNTLTFYQDIANNFDNVKILDCESITYEDRIHLIGATLWTDLRENPADLWFVQQRMNDFKRIRSKDYVKPISTLEWTATHKNARLYIENQIQYANDNDLIPLVVTHHAPHPLSIADQYKGDTLNCCYMSDLTDVLLDLKPKYWIHGHVHQNFDYIFGDTNVLCNPRGYAKVEPNFDFDPQAFIQI